MDWNWWGKMRNDLNLVTVTISFHVCFRYKLFQNIFQLMFTVVARLLLQFNSSVNPIVYATTVPEFRTTINQLLRCGSGKK